MTPAELSTLSQIGELSSSLLLIGFLIWAIKYIIKKSDASDIKHEKVLDSIHIIYEERRKDAEEKCEEKVQMVVTQLKEQEKQFSTNIDICRTELANLTQAGIDALLTSSKSIIELHSEVQSCPHHKNPELLTEIKLGLRKN